MKSLYSFCVVFILSFFPFWASAQQQVAVMSRCGGVDTVTIPNIIDNDLDGMDDNLEQILLDHFMPVVIQFDNENCPGPALDGTGDSNLIACHIYPYPQQYTRSTSLDSVLTHPVAVVPAHGLHAGLIWYNPLIKINTAVLYGEDCGLSGHKADVEGFNFSLKYIGPDTAAGWMYDTIMANWMGGTIQSISHAATLCQQVETRPYKSTLFPTGLDTIYASPDKHGNYLTIGGCGASFICNPGCGGIPITKHCKNINLGEPNATLVTDMGNLYPAYAGNPPWQTANFLSAQSGNAGAIRDKMIMPLTSDFISGQTLTTAQICPLYYQCYGPAGSAALDYTCAGDSLWFYGQFVTQPGVYQKVLTDTYGCDSTITITLAFRTNDSTSFAASFCQNSAYNFNGQLLTVAGLYTDTLTNVSGCDSIVHLILLSDTSANVSWPGPDTVYITGNSALTGGTPPGGVYTGIGVTDTTYSPNSALDPQVVTYSFTDSSGCGGSVSKTFVVATVTGIGNSGFSNAIALYPNPVNDNLILESSLFLNADINALVYDLTGNTRHLPLSRQGNKLIFNTTQLAEGMYWIKFNLSGNVVSKKFVKVM